MFDKIMWILCAIVVLFLVPVLAVIAIVIIMAAIMAGGAS